MANPEDWGDIVRVGTKWFRQTGSSDVRQAIVRDCASSCGYTSSGTKKGENCETVKQRSLI
jgi:hypothetical protein